MHDHLLWMDKFLHHFNVHFSTLVGDLHEKQLDGGIVRWGVNQKKTVATGKCKLNEIWLT